jgi:hypothetical protein
MPEVRRIAEQATDSNLPETSIDDLESRATTTVDADFIDRDTQDLDGQIRVRKDRGQPDEVLEHVYYSAPLGTEPGREVGSLATGSLHHPTLQHDRLDHPDLVLGQQPSKLASQRTERPRLDLDQQPGGINRVDPEPAQGDLGACSRAIAIAVLQRPVQTGLHGASSLSGEPS